MSDSQEAQIRKIKPIRVLLPTVLGMAIVIWLAYRDFHKIDFNVFEFSRFTLLFFLAALALMVCRDLGYVIRLRVLSDKELSWRKAIRIVLLWEFGSAITPSAIGGTALATIFIWKEGVHIGKSTSIVVATSFLDELFFSLVFPLIFIVFSQTELFSINGGSDNTSRFLVFALIGYGMKLSWTILMGYSIFINPRFFASLISKLFKIRILRRWETAAKEMASNFELSNREYKTKKLKFWLKGFFATFLSWTSRFLVLNFLLLALVFSLGVNTSANIITIYDHFLILARQLIMWIMMLVMPTPGGSGFVESIFSTYMADFVPVAGFVVIVALIWRLVTYYPYLVIGSVITPRWVNKNFKRRKNKNKQI